MGAYVYKVSTKAADYGGVKVHPAAYAYKPYWYGHDAEKLNTKMRLRTGCFAIEAAWRKRGNPGYLYVMTHEGKVANGAAVREAPPGANGILWDDSDSNPIVGHIVDGRYVSAELLNKVTREKTAFKSFNEVITDHPGYRPSLDMRQADLKLLADAYDAVQSWRGDARRAYRYGMGPAIAGIRALPT